MELPFKLLKLRICTLNKKYYYLAVKEIKEPYCFVACNYLYSLYKVPRIPFFYFSSSFLHKVAWSFHCFWLLPRRIPNEYHLTNWWHVASFNKYFDEKRFFLKKSQFSQNSAKSFVHMCMTTI